MKGGAVIDILRKDGTVRCTKVRLTACRYLSNRNIAIEAEYTGESRIVQGDGLGPGELMCDGEPWGTLTANTPEELEEWSVGVKDYSEGEGYLTTLMSAGLVETPHRIIRSGNVLIPVCRLTDVGRKFVSESLGETQKEEVK